MAIQFDVGELSSELAKLRSRPQLHKLAIVLPISPAKREVAWDFLAEGQPFDIQAIGLDSTAPREAGNVGGANVEGAERRPPSISTETGRWGIAVRPAPGLSKAVRR